MKSKRYVPLIMGIASIGVAFWLILSFESWWRFIPAVLLLAFGWPSLKTGLFASDREIRELTGEESMSRETTRKFEDRV